MVEMLAMAITYGTLVCSCFFFFVCSCVFLYPCHKYQLCKAREVQVLLIHSRANSVIMSEEGVLLSLMTEP